MWILLRNPHFFGDLFENQPGYRTSPIIGYYPFIFKPQDILQVYRSQGYPLSLLLAGKTFRSSSEGTFLQEIGSPPLSWKSPKVSMLRTLVRHQPVLIQPVILFHLPLCLRAVRRDDFHPELLSGPPDFPLGYSLHKVE
jgi:hypothetical protein